MTATAGSAIAWLFPGQGAQQRGMGAELFPRFPDLVATADQVLGYSLRELCLEDPGDRLRRTEFQQPALYAVCALSYLARHKDGAPEPRYLAGHSLGEYAALFAAGCFDFATGLRLVARRGQLLGQAAGGGMAAVLGPPADRVRELLTEAGTSDLDIANLNAPAQVVVAGPAASIDRLAELIRRGKHGRCVPLRVSAAFHSRYMAPAARQFGQAVAECSFAPPRIPVVANVTARPYRDGEVADLLVRQISSPVRWLDSMRFLRREGVREICELGPGRTLTGLWSAAAEAGPGRPDQAEPAGRPRQAIGPERLGSAAFRRDYRVRYAYVAGGMFRGVASVDLVVRMARAGLMAFFGTGGLGLDEVGQALEDITSRLMPGASFGMNLLHALGDPQAEQDIVDLYLRHDVRFIEAAAYPQVTPAVVRFRFSGAHRNGAGPTAVRRVLAKVSRPEVARAFMAPPEEKILHQLVRDGRLTAAEADAARSLPVSSDVCVEADSGGHTDGGAAFTLLPAMVGLRDEVAAAHRLHEQVRVGAAGGIGAPEAIAAAFVLGADFVVTGSVNQCSPEAGTSDAVKDLLAGLDVQDTGYAPAGDMFELGARVQVVRKGTLFAARANKLYQLYRQHESLDEIDAATRRSIETSCFGQSFDEVWEETRRYLKGQGRERDIEAAQANPKHKMALVFRWYFARSARTAIQGDPGDRVNYQIHCGPAIGAFNRFVKGTSLEDWRSRHVDEIADRLMCRAAALLQDKFTEMAGK
jgi:trans-AT polyketide synthase/acyltransferase/oxidoreductase domain-containing protein